MECACGEYHSLLDDPQAFLQHGQQGLLPPVRRGAVLQVEGRVTAVRVQQRHRATHGRAQRHSQ